MAVEKVNTIRTYSKFQGYMHTNYTHEYIMSKYDKDGKFVTRRKLEKSLAFRLVI